VAMEIHAAARALLDAIGAHGQLQPAWKPTRDFQVAWNASSLPFFTQQPKLKPDGIYGPLTTKALLHVVTLESERAAMPAPTDVSGVAHRWGESPQRDAIAVQIQALAQQMMQNLRSGHAPQGMALDTVWSALSAIAAAPDDPTEVLAELRAFGQAEAAIASAFDPLVAALRGVRTGYVNPEGIDEVTVWRCLYDCTPGRKVTLVSCEPLFTGGEEAAELVATKAGAELTPPAAGPKGYAIAVLERGDHPALTACPWAIGGGDAFRTSGFDLGGVLRGVEQAAHVVEEIAGHPGQDAHDIEGQAAWDVTHPAQVASDIAHGVEQVRQAVRPVGDAYLSVAQSVVSMIPGIGTGVSSALGAAQAILDGGGALDVAIRMAYGMIPIPPGLRQICDPIVDAVLGLVDAATHGRPLTDVALQVVRDRLPAGLPRDVFDTLARVVAQKLTIAHDPAAMREHMAASYGGHGAHDRAVAKGMARHVPPAVAARLKNLPPPRTRYAGAKRPPPPAPGARPAAAAAPAVTLQPSTDASASSSSSSSPAAPARRRPPPPPPRLRPAGDAGQGGDTSQTSPAATRTRPAPPPPGSHGGSSSTASPTATRPRPAPPPPRPAPTDAPADSSTTANS
jgi:hypothetical protein